jgi:hypothetical protein
MRVPGVTGLEDLALSAVAPATWLPGTHVVISGQSFVDPVLGRAHLRLSGTLGPRSFDQELDATYLDSTQLTIDLPTDGLPGEGSFAGQAVVVFDSLVDGQSHPSAPLALALTLTASLTPTLDHVGTPPHYVNDPAQLAGDGFLLGGAEGETRAVVAGCFQAEPGGPCKPVTPAEVPARPISPFDRTAIAFPYATAISGIRPGTFMGTVKLRNVLGSGLVRESAEAPVTWQLGRPMMVDATPRSVSLGQYLFFHGGGFVGGESDEVTVIQVEGRFLPEGGGAATPVTLSLVPEFVDGRTARFVLDEQDGPLAAIVDLRHGAGHLSGTMTPTVRKGSESLDGEAAAIDVDIAHLRQVVWVRFGDSYVDSLRIFGLRGADSLIRARIFELARRDYQGVNIEFRADEPTDFALFSTVDIGGPDPNDLGLLGYDNTPGKDVGNMRLFDRIGGVNATTQQDGSPGYGGIFAEEFLGFSEHPVGVQQLPTHTPLFDQIFDSFRPDQGGQDVTAEDLGGGGPPLASGATCPAQGRKDQLGCAIFVLGNLIGTTMTHEIGHSLGLANPYGEGYHDPGDLPNRLMDAGGARSFEERAELMGQGPAVFCDTEYQYLRATILAGAAEPAPSVERPSCQ